MPVVVSNTGRRVRQSILCLPLLALTIAGFIHEPPPLHDQSCLTRDDGLILCAASDMARITRTGSSRLEHPRFDLHSDTEEGLSWSAVRNETLAFQLIVRRVDSDSPTAVNVVLPDSAIQTRLYQAHYHQLNNAGYNWGPATSVLPYPAAYPDALIPQRHGCGTQRSPLYDSISLPRPGRNQSIWIEMYIPDSTVPGIHELPVDVLTGSESTTLTVRLNVLNAALPHTTSIDAVGEIYRSYRLEGVGEDRRSAEWKAMAQCYQTIAHQHRMVFIERTPDAPESSSDWQHYADAVDPALTGELFSDASAYTGTGRNTPVSVWRTPWPQAYDMGVAQALSDDQLQEFSDYATAWNRQVIARGWQHTRYFAYIFDEVDGPGDKPESNAERQQYIARVHGDMESLQAAIDAGTRGVVDDDTNIDLLWTSHSDPTVWLDNADTTLVDRVRLWAPNAHAANTDFLAERIQHGERAWFYHSGHPAVGGHSINLPGTDMRSWGVIGARYGLQGQLMWAVNLGSDDLPFAQPSYKPEEDRVGNGVLVYPGNQLPRIGFPAVPGPLPSMRLKAWHRGLQDAELYFLAYERYPLEAEALIKKLVPYALGEAVQLGHVEPGWPADSASWMQWRDDLIGLLQRE